MMSTRRLRRFFTLDPIQQAGDAVHLESSESEHLSRILRMKEGDSCLVTDGSGKEAEALVQEASNKRAKLLIQKVLPKSADAEISLFLYPAFIQRGKMDELVRQLQELGIRGFFPIETERTIVKMDAQAKTKVLERWEKIVQEAAKQSGSVGRLQCAQPESLKNILAEIPPREAAAVFHPGAESQSFSSWIQTLSAQTPLHLFFGPEGGFSEKEIALFESWGAARVGLGGTILKADTAVLGTAAALKFIFSKNSR